VESSPAAFASERLGRGSELLEELLRMLARCHLGEGELDLSVGADEVADASRGWRVRVVGGAVGEPDVLVDVAQEREVELVLFGEGAIGLLRIEAAAEDLDVQRLVVAGSITEPDAFRRSTRGVRHRVEPQEHALAAQARQRDRLSIVRLGGEVGCRIADVEHGHGSPPWLHHRRS
jgi:hypothetical protein